MVDQPPIKLDFFTRLLDIHFPDNSGADVALVNTIYGGTGNPVPTFITGLPFPGGDLINITQLGQTFAVKGTTPVAAQISPAMLKNLFAWSAIYKTEILSAGNQAAGILPAFSESAFVFLNLSLIASKFTDWNKKFVVQGAPLVGSPQSATPRTYYIVWWNGYAPIGGWINPNMDPFQPLHPPAGWFAVFGAGYGFPNVSNQTIFANFLSQGGGTGYIPYANGDATAAAACAAFLVEAIGGTQSGPNLQQVYVTVWNTTNGQPVQEADYDVAVGLYNTNPNKPLVFTQTFDPGYLQGSDTFSWFSPPPPPPGDTKNHANIAPNGPVTVLHNGIQSSFTSLNEIDKTVTYIPKVNTTPAKITWA